MTSTINNNLNNNKTEKAIISLLKYEKKLLNEKNTNQITKKNLFDTNGKPLLVQFQLKKPIKRPVIRPIRIKIPNSLFIIDQEDHNVCLFCRSDDKNLLDNELEKNPIDGVTRVISINQVKKNFKSFKERKELFSQFSHFLCDNRIFSQLINLLGKVFTRRNNHPIPIDLTNMKKFESVVMKSIHNSTYLHLSGQTLTVRMGYTSMDVNDVVVNVQEGIRNVVEKIGCGWGGIMSIHIKTSDSPALPIHNSYASEIGDYVDSKIVKKESEVSKRKEEVEEVEEVNEEPVKKSKFSPKLTRSAVKKRNLEAKEEVKVLKKVKKSKK